MHKPESILENDTHNSFWDFEIQTDHPLRVRRAALVLINKKKEGIIYWILSPWQTEKKKRKKDGKYLDQAKELKNSGTSGWRWYQL